MLSTTAFAAMPDGPGDQAGDFSYGGLDRTFLVHVPAAVFAAAHSNAPTPASLVIALHGGAFQGQDMKTLTNLNTFADQNGFIVAYPDAIGERWNDGRDVADFVSQKTNVDDVGFISTLIDNLHAAYGANTASVHVVGYSDGALMAGRVACQLSDRVTAVATVAGTLADIQAPYCNPSQPLSMMMIEGMNDPIMPFNGGNVFENGQLEGQVTSVPETLQYWVQRDGCPALAQIWWLPNTDPSDGTQIQEEYRMCSLGMEVVLMTVYGGGHTWPGYPSTQPTSVVGNTSYDINASDLVTRFFANH